jgi:hypothetical protein
VHRPDEAGIFEDGLVAEGQSPFAERCEQTRDARP